MNRIGIKELGDYQICFDYTFSYQTRKFVFFEVFLWNTWTTWMPPNTLAKTHSRFLFIKFVNQTVNNGNNNLFGALGLHDDDRLRGLVEKVPKVEDYFDYDEDDDHPFQLDVLKYATGNERKERRK
ncbi:hypothetical protein L596_009289 [Steinernema carpocapsae]|uniref:GOLD domain-containing protein n=1 Tax=Steinernema carpocapsae TaxID=34508 RepID=A0A4U5PEY4_STECR|nr:hypothetical protein L596_009289 [Steinernema carpocapsae]